MALVTTNWHSSSVFVGHYKSFKILWHLSLLIGTPQFQVPDFGVFLLYQNSGIFHYFVDACDVAVIFYPKMKGEIKMFNILCWLQY